ncbi:MAG TPA: branched chain amino acid aminotransferase, partial [Rhizobium sp.]|nr:branched chain amino acid aminotransferase [Rhizobium sp.]
MQQDALTFAIRPNASQMPEADRLKAFENLGFGTLFSDHMAVIRWSADKGWHSAEVTARAPFPLDPAAAVLHYAQ